MEFMTKPQQKALNKFKGIKSNDNAKEKGFFPKRHFTSKDILKLIKNRKRISPTIKSLIKTSSIIKNHSSSKEYKTKISKEEFYKLDNYIQNILQMNSWGVASFTEKEIFKGNAIPYKNVIVLSKRMKNDHFIVEELPNIDCMLEVMEVYGDTGTACLKVTSLLRSMGFGALPNHSLGGNVDYTKAGYKANLGFIGKHGLLITPHSGPCNRLSIIYTSIENLNDFMHTEDHSWGNSFCNKCKKCVATCPYNAIYEDNKIDKNGHIECISNQICNSGFTKYGCAICIAACPFTKLGYSNIKSKVIK
ncbi:hypothetical protein AN640_03180 [Candidatus Epulonipiscium fishelsonii]|uniref:Uncharacterized protein n=1 Tax=Candidatus Epulonipiscium fishelsonii TaxID=77094 RepID=A0ACC8XJD7_9FIRM|nr:hypothetical protein AN640_03180 [Epulopiscium sp. SCG-D08WGA-EpuloA1]OON92498.1 MAG: hypothetical protein ATN32_09615 [Epulopiscium sp. AS2M-Bin002]